MCWALGLVLEDRRGWRRGKGACVPEVRRNTDFYLGTKALTTCLCAAGAECPLKGQETVRGRGNQGQLCYGGYEVGLGGRTSSWNMGVDMACCSKTSACMV